MRKKTVLLISSIVLFLTLGIIIVVQARKTGWKLLSPLGKVEEKKEKPLEKYTFERLKEREPKPSEIVLEGELGRGENFTSYLFFYTSEEKKISGLANIPQGEGPFPVIVMLRGWVDESIYETGIGTQKAGEVLAQNGYITLAPDFLGYGESDLPPEDIWESRFMRNINIIDLLASVKNLDQADPERIGIWGHSNGGLGSLTVLELTGKPYPTTLWAPVSQFFPYDILFYIFEADDRGKYIRKEIARLEEDYDIEKYSFDNYLDWIKAPIQLHQGTADPYIPMFWSESLVERLSTLGLEINYYTYPGAGHQMEGSWDFVVQRDLQFFNQRLKHTN